MPKKYKIELIQKNSNIYLFLKYYNVITNFAIEIIEKSNDVYFTVEKFNLKGTNREGDYTVYEGIKNFDNAVKRAVEFLEKKGEIGVADFRDLVGTNRNLAVIILESMDSRGITMRKGNIRVLLNKK